MIQIPRGPRRRNRPDSPLLMPAGYRSSGEARAFGLWRGPWRSPLWSVYGAASGLPDEQIPAHYHRIAVLIATLIASEAGLSTLTPEEHEQGMELFRVAVIGADPERFPALAHFARDVRPLRGDRRAAFDEILAAHLTHVEAAIRPS
ncbi:MAG: hypothetical protein ABIQ18_34500 [Umezawaea sp.]